jgi:hypothetical protein
LTLDAPARPVAVVVGYLVRYPLAGMAWVNLNWMLGLRDLGFEPVFMEAAVTEQACWDVDAAALTDDAGYGTRFLEDVLAAVGLAGSRWWYRGGGRNWGMSADEAEAVLESSAVLVNVGASSWCRAFERAPRRVLVDCDAPLTQLKLAEGREPLTTMVAAHDTLATSAVNLAEGGGGPFPTGGRQWIPVVPPVHVDSWPAVAMPAGGRWTTVTSWSTGATARHDGVVYGQKDRQYERLMALPSMVEAELELAVASNAPTGRLVSEGWRVIDPVPVTRTLDALATYVHGSRGELAVAKEGFVVARTGAMNDRSLLYLASGRPVVCSDVGLDWLPVGEGLLTFSGSEDAASAIRTVDNEPQRHAKAARALAERFAAAAVVGRLLADADVAP